MTRMPRTIAIAAMAGVMALLAACSASEKIKDAGPAVDAFRHQLDAEAYPAIWQGADDLLHQNTTEPQFVQFVGAVHRKLGKVVQSERTGWNVNYGTSGTIVTVAMTTRFERGPAPRR